LESLSKFTNSIYEVPELDFRVFMTWTSWSLFKIQNIIKRLAYEELSPITKIINQKWSNSWMNRCILWFNVNPKNHSSNTFSPQCPYCISDYMFNMYICIILQNLGIPPLINIKFSILYSVNVGTFPSQFL